MGRERRVVNGQSVKNNEEEEEDEEDEDEGDDDDGCGRAPMDDGRWMMTRTMMRPCVRLSVREARASVGRFGTSRSFVTERDGTERAGRVGEDVVVVSSGLVFKSFLWRRTRDDDGARMVRRRR